MSHNWLWKSGTTWLTHPAVTDDPVADGAHPSSVRVPTFTYTAPGVSTTTLEGTISPTNLPSYVDDVVVVASVAGLPAVGETDKAYVAEDTGASYVWSGSAYVKLNEDKFNSVGGDLTGTSGNGFLGNLYQTTVGALVGGIRTFAAAAGKWAWKLANGNQVTLDFTPVSASRNYQTQDRDGVLALTDDLEPYDRNAGLASVNNITCSIVMVGDSISCGNGANNLTGFSYGTFRSLSNARDGGLTRSPGHKYHTNLNCGIMVNEPGFTTTGTIAAAGICNSRIDLATGQSITITGRAANYMLAVIDPTNSTGSLVLAVNGVTKNTMVPSGTSLQSSGFIAVASEWYFSESTSFTFTATGGSVRVCAATAVMGSSNTPLMWSVPYSGTAYQDYTSTAQMDELAYWLNLGRTSNEKVLVLNLGTNNIYSASKYKTPDNMVTEMNTLITGIQSRCTNLMVAIAVPPKADEGIWPIQAAGYTYDDYVKAIVTYARANNHSLVRYDRCALSRRADLYADGLHPNGVGHRVMMRTLCDLFGVPANPYRKTGKETIDLDTVYDVTMNGTWRPYLNTTSLKIKAHKPTPNTVCLSGICEPNGSASTTAFTLPSNCWPDRTCHMIFRTDAGAVGGYVNTSGAVVLLAVPSQYFSVEGVSFQITRNNPGP